MTTDPALLTQLLDDEVEVARSRLGDWVTGIERVGPAVRVPLSAPDGGPPLLMLGGANFDAEPFGVAVTETNGSPAVLERWPAGLGALASGAGRVGAPDLEPAVRVCPGVRGVLQPPQPCSGALGHGPPPREL